MNVDLDELRARVRGEAGQTADQVLTWLDAADAATIAGVPRKVRRTRSVSGRVDWTRDSAEHDELDLPSPAELDHLRDAGWITHTGRADADEILERLAATYTLGGIDDAWQRWLHETKLVDCARIVARGKVPTGAWVADFRWWHEVAPVCEADGIDIRAVMASRAVDDTERGALVATVHAMNAALVAYLDRLVFPPKVQYARSYAAALIAGTSPPADPGDSWAPDVRRKVDRYYRMEDAA